MLYHAERAKHKYHKMYRKRIKSILFCLASAFLCCLFSAFSASARNGSSLYLSPNSGTFSVGNTFNISIFVNTHGQNVNTVKADLKFDPKKLQLANPSAGKSFISVWIVPPSYSNTKGTLTFQGGLPSPGINTSAGLVSTVTFRAMSPGETSVSLLNTSQALLNDGNGTNVLDSFGSGIYSITILPPEGPAVSSSTHPDSNKWEKNNNPSFSWEKGGGVADFSYMIDLDPKGIPDNISEGSSTSISYSELKDGIWYFHIKAKRGQVWGGITHYAVSIDDTMPASFSLQAYPGARTDIPDPIISFLTTDSFSGTDHYEMKIIDITPDRKEKEEPFFIEVTSPYRLPKLETGKYMIAVRAFDEAGNWRDESMNLEIIPKGMKIQKEGVWTGGILFAWWVIFLAFIILLLLILLAMIYLWSKKRQRDKRHSKELKIKELELKKHYEKFN